MFDPNIQRYKVTTMQRLQDYVRQGYYFHTSGKVPATRAQKLANKFAVLYEVDLSKFARSRRKAKGQGNAVLFLYPIADSTDLFWWLLVTEGDHPANRKETLFDSREKHQRVRWDDQYELVRMTKPGQQNPSWTWRMTSELEEGWRYRIRKSISSKNDTLVKQLIYSLYRSPGFFGVRQQVGQLVKTFRADWRRIKKSNQRCPHLPSRLGYIRRLSDDIYPLSTLVRRQQKGAASWFPRKSKV